VADRCPDLMSKRAWRAVPRKGPSDSRLGGTVDAAAEGDDPRIVDSLRSG